MSSSTSTLTAATAPASGARWTVDSMALHMRNEFNVDRNATGGSIPDHLTRTIRDAGQYIWTVEDWVFRLKRGTLTTVAESETADLATDFYKLWTPWLRDPQGDTLHTIVFTQDPTYYQRVADRYDMTETADDAAPMVALIAPTSGSTFGREVYLAPRPDAEYTYPYWYLTSDPWLSGTTGDDEAPAWPKPYDDGWYMRARYKMQSIHRGDDSWRELRNGFLKWLAQTKKENDETIANAAHERGEAWYRDLQRTPRALSLQRTGLYDSFFPR